MDFVVQNNVLCKYKGHDGAVVIPEGVTAIGDSAFQCCDSLQSVTLLERVTEIGKNAFEGCYSLQSVTIPERVTTIGESAFWYCNSLENVTIPERVTEIGGKAFANCEYLQSVTIQANACKISESAFGDSHPVLIAPHIPISSFDDENKPDACAGFAKLYCDQAPLSEDIRASYLAYIRSERKALYPRAMEYLPLLQVMTAEKIIPPEDFEELLQDALQKGGAERTALLLEYRHKYLDPLDWEREFEIEEL